MGFSFLQVRCIRKKSVLAYKVSSELMRVFICPGSNSPNTKYCMDNNTQTSRGFGTSRHKMGFLATSYTSSKLLGDKVLIPAKTKDGI